MTTEFRDPQLELFESHFSWSRVNLRQTEDKLVIVEIEYKMSLIPHKQTWPTLTEKTLKEISALIGYENEELKNVLNGQGFKFEN